MSSDFNYRQAAAECVRVATGIQDREVRKALLDLAVKWSRREPLEPMDDRARAADGPSAADRRQPASLRFAP